MRQLNGNIHCLIRKIEKVVIVVACIIVIVFLYARWNHGSIHVDDSFFNEYNIEKIGSEWKQLIDSGTFIELPAKNDPAIHTLKYDNDVYTARQDDDTIVFVLIRDNVVQLSDVHVTASYVRNGIIDAIYGGAKFGECTSRFSISNGKCSIEALFLKSSGTMSEMNEFMQFIMNTIG